MLAAETHTGRPAITATRFFFYPHFLETAQTGEMANIKAPAPGTFLFTSESVNEVR